MKQKPVVKKIDPKAPKEGEAPVKIRHEDLPIISGRAGEVLTLMGFLHAGQITKIFFKVLDTLKNSTYDVRWRYKLPCLMMVGPSGSGKSTLLENLNFEHLTVDGSAIDSMWKLFKEGIIFELPRTDLAEETGKFWSFISELFVFIRPRRPLDGIIITLPADMLLSESVDLEKQSKEIFERIFKFQHEVNFHLPLYLVITKTDIIPGFNEFVSLLNDDAKQQIFGWSCPYTIHTAFSSKWISEIFETINEGIKRAIVSLARSDCKHLEQAVLFEYRVKNIQPVLEQYLNVLLKTHSPEEGLLLRGVYFVGQRQQDVMKRDFPDILRPSALSPTANFSLNHSYSNNVYFAQDLFMEKIFKEYNIAHPIRIDSVDMNKTEQRNKIIMAFGAAAMAFGWFWGNHHIKNKIYDYYLAMAAVKTSMVKIKYLESHIKGEDDQALINKQTSTLLKNIPSVKRFDFISIFIPQSWFSTIRRELLETIGLVFDSVIIRAMYIDINLNVKHILRDIGTEAISISTKNDILDINAFASLKKMRNFVETIERIERISAEYDSVRQLEDRKSVADLTKILFGEDFEIANDVKDRIPNKKLIPPKFNISLFQEKIEANLTALFTAFLGDVLNATIEKLFKSLSDDVNRLAEAARDAAIPYFYADLARIYNKTLLVIDILKSKNFSWISSDHFVPCQEYVKIMDKLGTLGVVRPDCLKELIKKGELEFFKFRSRLLNYTSELTGKLLTANANSVSVGFESFQKEIKLLLEQSFVRVAPKGQLTTIIPEDKMLIWDTRRLKELSNLIDKYREFMENMPQDIRPQYSETYRTVVRKCFHPIVNAMLGNAQIFEDLPLGHSNDLLAEAYRRQANNINESTIVLAKVAKILDEMQEEDNAKDFGFSPMIVSHYLDLLVRTDVLFNREAPYSSGHAVFDNWDGEHTPKYLNLRDSSALKEYLSSQFERIRFLAKDLAAPVVDLLSLPHFTEKIRNHKLVRKWSEIISSIKSYESKTPGNSIEALESFLSDNLSKVSLGSFDENGEIKTLSETGGDYFLSRRSDVAKSLLSRAEVVKYEKAANAYERAKIFFNEHLAHKFPFGTLDQESSLKDVEKFVKIYEQGAKNALDTLIRNKDQRKVSGQALEFLKNMNDKIIPFLRTWVNHSKASDAKSALVSFNIQIRPSPELEALTSSVVDREVFIGDTLVKDKTDSIFFNNDRMRVVFRWVASSDEKLNEQAAQGHLTISGSDASFSYEGRWAMFKMIEEQRMNKEGELANGILLQFMVPIIDTSKENALLTSKMVLKVSPMAKIGDKLTPMTWPVFPESFPNLHEEVTNPSTPKGLDVNVSFDRPTPETNEIAATERGLNSE
jgi:type VI secretion system protein ImpL